MSELSQPVSKSNRHVRRWIILGFIVVLLLLASPLVYTGVIIYGGFSNNNLTTWLTNTLPYPAAIVDNQWVLYRDYETQVDNVQKVAKQLAADPSTASRMGPIPTRAVIASTELDQMINEVVLEQSAQKFGLTVSQAEIDQTFTQQIISQTNGNEAEVEKTLEQLYGWTIAQFKTSVVKQLVLRQKLLDYLLQHNKAAVSQKSDQLISQVLAQAKKQPDQFASLAQQYSQDGSATQGGDVGWIKKGDMVPAFETASFALKNPNDISEVIELPSGYDIIQLIETKDEQVHVRHILIKFALENYLQQQRSAGSVYIFVPNSIANLTKNSSNLSTSPTSE